MKKVLIVITSVLVTVAVIVGAYSLGFNSHKHENNEATSQKNVSTSTKKSVMNSSGQSSSTITNSENTADYDPNKTATGVAINGQLIQKVSEELKNAGLPVDTWAPSDIKTIITQSSQQGISAVDYAKQNYHG